MYLKIEMFPINYFKSIWSPIRAFKNRFQLNWVTLSIVIIFINSLMIIPTTINFTKMEAISLDYFYPKVVEIIDESMVDELTSIGSTNGKLSFEDSFIFKNNKGVLAGGISAEEEKKILKEETFLLMEESQFVIKEENKPTSTIFYTKDFTLEDAQTKEDVINEFSRQWFVQNKVLIVLIFTLIISFIQLIMLVMIIFGSAFFLYLTKKSRITSISTFKEAINLIVNLAGLPTIIATIYGLINYDVAWMSMIQTTGLVIMLLIVYGKTGFNDNRIP